MSEQNTAPVEQPQVDGAPGADESVPGGQAPGKLGRTTKAILAIVAVALVGVGAFLLWGMLNQDGTADAKAGDCIASLKMPDAGESADVAKVEVVDCASSEAKFNIVGRVDGKTKAQFNADTELKTCTDAGHQTSEYMIWSGRGADGYVLCLAEQK